LNSLLAGYRFFIRGRAIYTELRAHVEDEEAKSIYISNDFQYEEHLNYIVNCRTPDQTWKAISESKKRQIKKAVKNGATIEETPSLSQVYSFYEILTELYRRIKKPLHQFSYFQALYEHGLHEGSVRFLLTMKDAKVIGGIVCTVSGKWRLHEHYIAGMDHDFKDFFPSVMATWAAIDYACKNGIAEFDFMGAGSPNEDYGVRDFKAKFGGELQTPGRFILVHSKPIFRVAKLGFRLYQKLGRLQ